MKTYVVVGLGRFGQSIACRLCELGNEVLALIRTRICPADFQLCDPSGGGRCPGLGCAPGFGHSNYDCAIVAIGKDLSG